MQRQPASRRASRLLVHRHGHVPIDFPLVLVFRRGDVQKQTHYLGTAGAELDRPRGAGLRHSPELGVVQRAVLDLVDHAGPAPAYVDFVEQRARRIAEPLAGRLGSLLVPGFQARPALKRILGPAKAGHVFVQMEVARGEQVQSGPLLVADHHGQGVLDLLAIADIQHAGVQRFAEHADVEPARAGKRAGGCRGQQKIFRDGEHDTGLQVKRRLLAEL